VRRRVGKTCQANKIFIARPKHLKEFPAKFYTSDYRAHKNRNPPRTAGTCEWFLAHEKYTSWVKERKSSLLWVSADPGCGKSVLASFLVDHLKSAKSQNALPGTVCFFFFKDDNNEQKSSIFALQALLHQVFCADRFSMERAYQYFKEETEARGKTSKLQEQQSDHSSRGKGKSRKRNAKGKLEPSNRDLDTAPHDFGMLWDIFLLVSQDSDAGNIVCVLDGLDEAQDGSQRELLKALAKFFTRKSDLLQRQPYTKIILLSRPENTIKVAFTRLPTIRLRGENEVEAISRDVILVIKESVENLMGDGFPDYLVADIQQALINGADRTFLWISLVIQLLRDALEDGASRRELQAILGTSDIYSIYDKLLRKTHRQREARRLLQIIIAATRPLTLEETCIALAFRPSFKDCKELEADLKYPFENYVKSVCGHFVRVIHSTVYLVHQTARAFLLSHTSHDAVSGYGSWQHSFSIRESNYVLLEISICYIFFVASLDVQRSSKSFESFTAWQNYTSRGSSPSDKASRSKPEAGQEPYSESKSPIFDGQALVLYAKSSWPAHLAAALGEKAAFIEVASKCQTIQDLRDLSLWTVEDVDVLLNQQQKGTNPTRLHIASLMGFEDMVAKLST
jgi:hypothetical protein